MVKMCFVRRHVPSWRQRQATSPVWYLLLAVCLVYSSTLKLEAIPTSETSINFCQTTRLYKSRDSAVGIATGYGLDGWGVGVRVPVGARMVTSPCRPDRLWVPLRLLSNVYWGPSPGLGREADRSPPSNAEVKRTWVYTTTPPYVFMA
jgi:hypothetical protein